MMKNCSFSIVVALFGAGVMAQSLDPMVPINPDMADAKTLASDLRSARERWGLRRFVLTGPHAVNTQFNRTGVEEYRRLGERIAEIRGHLSGTDIEIGWWLAPTFRQGRSISQLASLIEQETAKFRTSLIPFYGIHQVYRMLSAWKSRGQSYDTVVLTCKGHLEWFCPINPCHKIAAFRFGYHTEGSSVEYRLYLDSRISKHRGFRIIEVDTSYILDMRISRTNPLASRNKSGS
jgi:hypothetical protein